MFFAFLLTLLGLIGGMSGGSPELSVEDSNNPEALQAVAGGGALPRLESVGQPLDFIPCAQILGVGGGDTGVSTRIYPLRARSLWRVNTHPGGIKAVLNGGPRASARLDDLSLGRQRRQQDQRKQPNGVHVSFTACRHRPKEEKKKETAV